MAEILNIKLPLVGNGLSDRRKPFPLASPRRFSGRFVVSSPNVSVTRKLRAVSLAIRVRASGSYDQVYGDGSDSARDSGSAKLMTWAQPLLKFAANNFLPIALVSGVVLGLANPTLGCLAHRYSMSKFSTFGIFLISGLTLRSEEIGAATKAWPAAVFGLMVPQEFITGLAIFSCMPTTLSSGVALTQLVGGNSALALSMTVLSNLLGIFIVPILLSKFIADGVGITVPTGQLFRSLVVTLLVPLIIGKVSRDCFNGVAEYVDRNRKLLSMTSAVCLSLVPWMQVSGSRSLLLMVQPMVFLKAVGMGMLLHLFLLALNTLATWSLSIISGGRASVFGKKENSRAVVLVTSQKTLPVMVAVVEPLRGALGESGMLILPCVAAHINQIIFDSFLVSFWLRKDRALNALKEA